MNKCQLELGNKTYVGDINQAALLDTAKGVSSGSGEAAIDLKYDWYQNVTHAFISYKIRRGGAQLKDGGLQVKFDEKQVILENSSNGEILASIDLGNPINCAESTYNCTERKVELKLAKAAKNENWSGVEVGSTASSVAAPISGKVPDYPSSSKNKKNW